MRTRIGQYPNLAAALTAPAAPPDDSEVFEAYLMRLIDGALGTSA